MHGHVKVKLMTILGFVLNMEVRVYSKYKLIFVSKTCCRYKSGIETEAIHDLSGLVPILGVGAGNFIIRIHISICWVAECKEYIRDNGRTAVV